MAHLSSVQVGSVRNPASTIDFNRRVKEKGSIDLSQQHETTKKRGLEHDGYSTRSGKRTKTLETTNRSRFATTLQTRWNQGAFRWVHKGLYTINPAIPFDDGGPQNGQLCVLKEFKSGSVYEDSFFQNDIKAVDKAGAIITAFNVHFANRYAPGKKTIMLNRPAVWQEVYPDSTGKHKKKLVEPMLEGEFLKFNSNSGYTNGAEFMQALSHYSYHQTHGQHLLCDLQGGHYEDCYVLTDPVVMSRNKKEFGATDLGVEGMNNFFAHHKCNGFCDRTWLKPTSPKASLRLPPVASTSMSLSIGTVAVKSEAERQKQLDAILSMSRR